MTNGYMHSVGQNLFYNLNVILLLENSLIKALFPWGITPLKMKKKSFRFIAGSERVRTVEIGWLFFTETI